MRVKQDEPFDVQPRANGAMAKWLRGATIAALVLGLAGAFVPGDAGHVLAWVAVYVVIAVPLLRITWLGGRWILRGDYLFALLAFGLLVVVSAAGIAAVSLR